MLHFSASLECKNRERSLSDWNRNLSALTASTGNTDGLVDCGASQYNSVKYIVNFIWDNETI